ncbi:MAG: SUMF1/EgtB/PvdO family nonheme iron enzyme [Verrucomicrobiales bacterium]|nr:SUMF1/EgtB/PvdO family nonheme iron enzyme [Verrucomicrobiales bacterium]
MPGKILSLIFCPLFVFGVVSAAGSDHVERNSVGMELRLIEGGRMLRGTDGGERALSRAFPLSVNAQFFGNPESPAHVTWITKPFWIASTEVTVGQWKKFVEETGYVTTAEKSGTGIVGWSPTPVEKPLYQSHDFEKKADFSWKNPGFPQDDSHPVVGVSWLDAQAFLTWLNGKGEGVYRLPTEAEWEFACRAGTQTWFSFGDQPRETIHRHANIGNVELEKHRKHSVERQWLLDWEKDPEDGHVFTAPVGSYEPNPFGLHDLHGNVWEWCQDHWLDTFYNQYDWPKRGEPRRIAVDPVNLSEPQTSTNQFRTIRGGSWYNGPIICRSSCRVGWDEPDAAAYIGFRVVREAEEGISTVAREAYEREDDGWRAIEAAGGEITSSGGLNLSLRFEGQEIPEEVFAKLARVPGIERLSLVPKETLVVTDSHLMAIVAMPDLISLDFRSSFDLDSCDLGILAQSSTLEALSFSRSTSLTDQHCRQLAKVTGLHSFEAWGTSGQLTDEGLSYLGGNRELETLRVSEVDATGEFLSAFLGCPLRHLSLTKLHSAEKSLEDRFAKQLTDFPELEFLYLNQQGLLTDSTLLTVANLEGLQGLTLQGCVALTDEGLAILGKLEKLRSLNLQGTAAGDAALRSISGIPRLKSMRLGSPNLTDRGFIELGKLVSLEDLYIETCSATDEGVRHLGYINRLKRLDLGVPEMEGIGLAPLAHLPELNDLRLRAPALTDVVFEIFSRAKSLRKLRLVERGWQPPARLSNSGMEAIANATWLSELWLPRNDTGLTEEAIEDLNQRMKKTSVIPYTVDWDRPEPAEQKGEGA